jgi:excisionase family DNA binding protein
MTQQTAFSPLMDARALSLVLSISPRTLETIVARGEGPPFIRLGRQRRWRLEDVDAWIKAKQALNGHSKLALANEKECSMTNI